MFCVANCHHIFGSACIRDKSYCIFNKQYSKQEYEKLASRIAAHMKDTGERGEYFDPSLSPFAYNETTAQDHYAMTKEDALSR